MPAAPLERSYARAVLDNGLQVLVVPEDSPLATVVVHVRVGWRHEEPDRSGFAHLFEHLMFEGSPGLPRGAYRERIHDLGGTYTAFTRADFTAYWSQVPSASAADALAVEADRLRGIAIDSDALRTQVSVVEEEIRVNVRNRPYGVFPFFEVPAALFSSYPNAHDGYGDFESLRRSTLAEVGDFFDRYYSPANVLVTLVAPVDPAAGIGLVADAFGAVAPRPGPGPVDLREPAVTEERRHTRLDPLAPLPAVALGFRVPDPADDDYLAAYLVNRLLTAGETSRLREVLVRREQVAHEVAGWFGSIDQPFTTRDPSLDTFVVYHDSDTDRVVSLVDETLAELADGGVDPESLARLQRAERTRYWAGYDDQVLRALQIGALEAVHGRAESFDGLPQRLAEIDADRVRSVAERYYRAAGRALVEIVPGAA